MHLLLHICCAPCTIFPLKTLRNSGVRITGYFYNPNIHPFKEYQKRKETLEGYAQSQGLEVLYCDRYDLENFLEKTSPWDSGRCRMCYRIRLEDVAREASSRKMEAFSTTLLYSRYQKHDWIREAGQEMGERYHINFFYQDFRTGWQDGIEESKALGLYRQPYCGCIFSEKERYAPKQRLRPKV
ncbi:MAG TPA: epoxyqueuosine reductase QueH [Thermodesulfobacteriota bacterium]|nr:epoxyqueuosine reductase QueH [Thermodesulfobacteriota bacterium]